MAEVRVRNINTPEESSSTVSKRNSQNEAFKTTTVKRKLSKAFKERSKKVEPKAPKKKALTPIKELEKVSGVKGLEPKHVEEASKIVDMAAEVVPVGENPAQSMGLIPESSVSRTKAGPIANALFNDKESPQSVQENEDQILAETEDEELPAYLTNNELRKAADDVVPTLIRGGQIIGKKVGEGVDYIAENIPQTSDEQKSEALAAAVITFGSGIIGSIFGGAEAGAESFKIGAKNSLDYTNALQKERSLIAKDRRLSKRARAKQLRTIDDKIGAENRKNQLDIEKEDRGEDRQIRKEVRSSDEFTLRAEETAIRKLKSEIASAQLVDPVKAKNLTRALVARQAALSQGKTNQKTQDFRALSPLRVAETKAKQKAEVKQDFEEWKRKQDYLQSNKKSFADYQRTQGFQGKKDLIDYRNKRERELGKSFDQFNYKSAAFASKFTDAEQRLARLLKDNPKLRNQMGGIKQAMQVASNESGMTMKILTGKFTDPGQKQVALLVEDMISAALRLESGAAISHSEFAKKLGALFGVGSGDYNRQLEGEYVAARWSQREALASMSSHLYKDFKTDLRERGLDRPDPYLEYEAHRRSRAPGPFLPSGDVGEVPVGTQLPPKKTAGENRDARKKRLEAEIELLEGEESRGIKRLAPTPKQNQALKKRSERIKKQRGTPEQVRALQKAELKRRAAEIKARRELKEAGQ